MEREVFDNIKKLRELRNFSQAYMARQLGMTQATYSRIETGVTDVSHSRLMEIAAILQVKPRDLISFNSDRFIDHVYNGNGLSSDQITITLSAEDVKKAIDAHTALMEMMQRLVKALEEKKR